MAILKVANVHTNLAGTTRIEDRGDGVIRFVSSSVEAANISSSGLDSPSLANIRSSIQVVSNTANSAVLATQNVASVSDMKNGSGKLLQANTTQLVMAWYGLSDGSTIAIDHKNGTNQRLTAAAARSITISNPIEGLPLNLKCNGNFAHTYSSGFDFGSDGVPSAVSSSYTIHFLIENTKARFMGIRRGFTA